VRCVSADHVLRIRPCPHRIPAFPVSGRMKMLTLPGFSLILPRSAHRCPAAGRYFGFRFAQKAPRRAVVVPKTSRTPETRPMRSCLRFRRETKKYSLPFCSLPAGRVYEIEKSVANHLEQFILPTWISPNRGAEQCKQCSSKTLIPDSDLLADFRSPIHQHPLVIFMLHPQAEFLTAAYGFAVHFLQ